MIQLLPSSYNQKRTVMLNYEVLVVLAITIESTFHRINPEPRLMRGLLGETPTGPGFLEDLVHLLLPLPDVR